MGLNFIIWCFINLIAIIYLSLYVLMMPYEYLLVSLKLDKTI